MFFTDGSAYLGPDFHDGLLEGVIVAGPGVPIDAVGETAMWAGQGPSVQVTIVAIAVPPTALKMSLMKK